MDDMRERFLDLLESDQTDPDVQYELGRCYLYGQGVEQDGQTAEKWLRRAAEQGQAEAKALLNSTRPAAPAAKGVTKGTLPAWCQRAEDGDSEAQYQVAVYFQKESVPGTKEDVRRYLSQAAEQGHPQACLTLGKELLHTDPAHAVQQLRNAADCGLPEASELLGTCYAEGQGVARNLMEAERRFCKAAELGDSESKLRMAMRYVKGDGVDQSQVKALSWVKRAEDAGMANAQKRFDQSCAEWQAELERRRKEEEKARRAEEQRQAEAKRRVEEERLARAQKEAEAKRQAELERLARAQREAEALRAEQRRQDEAKQQARLAAEAAAKKREVWEGPLLVVITWLAAGMPVGWLLTLTRWAPARQILARIFFPLFLWPMRWMHPILLILLWAALYRVGRWRMDVLQNRLEQPTSSLMRFFWEFGPRIYKWAGWGFLIAVGVVTFFGRAWHGGILGILSGIIDAGVSCLIVYGLLFYWHKRKQ